MLYYEKPDCYPDPSRLPAIADELGCTIDALFGRANPVTVKLTPRGVDLLLYFPEAINSLAAALDAKLDDTILNGRDAPKQS